MIPTAWRQQRQNGFTLVELLMVIVILGFLVGLVMPFANHQDTQTKIKRTNAILEDIRMAILGARNSFDAQGHRVIGGYVGDVGHLPKLYVFDGKDNAWNHDRDADKEPDTTANFDGTDYGKDNAEPVALWRNSLKVAEDSCPKLVPDDDWQGPYMAPPRDPFPDDSIDDWETGINEQKKQFYLRECQGRLTDAWGRALIIYVEDIGDSGLEEDKEIKTDAAGAITPLNLVFVSAGPDGRYDASDPADTDNTPEDDNTDNLVLRISKNEWDTAPAKELATQKILLDIKQAIIGQAPNGLNDGYTGDVLDEPKLFHWRDDDWHNQDTSSNDYTKGQPRGLWTRPVSIPLSVWTQPGVSWRHAYIQEPWGDKDNEVLRDAWGREILFFKIKSPKEGLFILSLGADGKYVYGDDSDPIEELDYVTYDVTLTDNKDNIVLFIPQGDWDDTSTTTFILQ